MNKIDNAPVFRPVLHPDADAKARRLHERISFYRPSETIHVGAILTGLLISSMLLSIATTTGNKAMDTWQAGWIIATVVFACAAAVGAAITVQLIADRKALRRTSSRHDQIVQLADFHAHDVRKALREAANLRLLPQEDSCSPDSLALTDNLPARIARWTNDAAKLDSEEAARLATRGAFLARDLFDNEKRRVELAIDRDVPSVVELADQIARQRATLDRLERKLADDVTQMARGRDAAQAAVRQAQRELGGNPDIAGVTLQQQLDAQLDLA